ncbi:hypothetical protein ABT186_47610 [Streptomyces sp. NPDC001634]|uniref:hypothetical protein n=1 Tax=Streptomyces sp. NPDC001634 TaxID=3154390 RepID=UPI0033233023
MKIIEDGLHVHDGFAGGPLAEAALRRTAQAVRRLDRLQEDPAALTDAQPRNEVRRVGGLRKLTRCSTPKMDPGRVS